MTQSISSQQLPQQQQYAPIPPTNTMAVLSLVFAFLFWPLSLVFGHIARKQIVRTGERGRGLATAGLAISYAGLALFVLIMLIGGLVANSAQTSQPQQLQGPLMSDPSVLAQLKAAPPVPVAPPAVPAAPPAPTGPVTSFGDGTYVVGTEIVAGTYKASASGQCYWARLSSTESEGDIIANHLASGPTTVTIRKSDAAFLSQNCGQWTKVG